MSHGFGLATAGVITDTTKAGSVASWHVAREWLQDIAVAVHEVIAHTPTYIANGRRYDWLIARTTLFNLITLCAMASEYSGVVGEDCLGPMGPVLSRL